MQSVVRKAAFSSVNGHCARPQRTTVSGRRQPLLSNPLECPSWVNFGLSRPTAATSAFRGKADEIGTITDIGQRMSAVGGRADVACQGLSGPFLAISGHCKPSLNRIFPSVLGPNRLGANFHLFCLVLTFSYRPFSRRHRNQRVSAAYLILMRETSFGSLRGAEGYSRLVPD